MSTPQDPFGPPGDSTPPAGGSPWGAPPPDGTSQPGGPYGQQRPAYGDQQPPAYGQQPPAYGEQAAASPGWGPPAGAGGPRRNGLGVAALVLGILALLTSFTVFGGIVLGIVAIVLGALGRGRAKRGEADNRGVATAGLVLGVIAVVVSAAVLAAGVSFLSSDTGRSLVDCLEQAGNDPAAVEQCQNEVVDQLER